MHPIAYKLSNDIVETVREPMLVMDGDLRINLANRSFYQTFKVVPAQTGFAEHLTKPVDVGKLEAAIFRVAGAWVAAAPVAWH
jgi:nitrogen-specific signal transduction histidine kinase